MAEWLDENIFYDWLEDEEHYYTLKDRYHAVQRDLLKIKTTLASLSIGKAQRGSKRKGWV